MSELASISASALDGDVIFTQLETSRFIIRRMIEDDVVGFHHYRSDNDIARYQSWSDYTLEDAQQFVNEQKDKHPNVPGQWIQLTIALRENNQIIGDCAFTTEADQPACAQIGVTISKEYQKKGVATEALKALLNYLFLDLKKHRVIARVDIRNVGSKKLFERHLQFRQEALFVENEFFKGEWCSEYVFAMLEVDWEILALEQQYASK